MYEVTITYKSGRVHKDFYKSFSVKTIGGKPSELEWEVCKKTKHKALLFGIDEIESVFSRLVGWFG